MMTLLTIILCTCLIPVIMCLIAATNPVLMLLDILVIVAIVRLIKKILDRPRK